MHELARDALVLRHEPAGEVEGSAGDVGMDVDPAGKYERAARVDCAAAIDLSDDPALGDADVLDYAFDPIGRIVNLSARIRIIAVPCSSGASSPPPSRPLADDLRRTKNDAAVILPRSRWFWIVADDRTSGERSRQALCGRNPGWLCR